MAPKSIKLGTALARNELHRGMIVPLTWDHNGKRLVVQIKLSEVKHPTSNIVIGELDKSQLCDIFRTMDIFAEVYPDHLDVASPTEVPRHFFFCQLNGDVEDNQLVDMCSMRTDEPLVDIVVRNYVLMTIKSG